MKKDKLKEIGKTLEEQMSRTSRLPLPEAVKIIETEGVEDASNVLKALGYKIVWRGISPETPEVIKPENQ